ncbi:hypothetical protein FHG87_007800 [Trinorchestia longiramus]|nr:hypothetical protein FHG87_007800 [Trinorchestia longiramus]
MRAYKFLSHEFLIPFIWFLSKLLPESAASNQACSGKAQEECGVNEMCVVKAGSDDAGICNCLPGYWEDALHTCQHLPPSSSEGHSGVAYGIAILLTLLVVVGAVVTVAALHQRYNILVPFSALCPSCGTLFTSVSTSVGRCFACLPSVNLFGVRSGRSRMMDDLSGPEDDVDPIA